MYNIKQNYYYFTLKKEIYYIYFLKLDNFGSNYNKLVVFKLDI